MKFLILLATTFTALSAQAVELDCKILSQEDEPSVQFSISHSDKPQLVTIRSGTTSAHKIGFRLDRLAAIPTTNTGDYFDFGVYHQDRVSLKMTVYPDRPEVDPYYMNYSQGSSSTMIPMLPNQTASLSITVPNKKMFPDTTAINCVMK